MEPLLLPIVLHKWEFVSHKSSDVNKIVELAAMGQVPISMYLLVTMTMATEKTTDHTGLVLDRRF